MWFLHLFDNSAKVKFSYLCVIIALLGSFIGSCSLKLYQTFLYKLITRLHVEFVLCSWRISSVFIFSPKSAKNTPVVQGKGVKQNANDTYSFFFGS